MKKRILSLAAALVMLFTLMPAAVAAEVPGQMYAAPNGDGATPFNLQWADTTKGIVSFEKQTKDANYRLELYRDGTRVAGTTVGTRDGKMTEEVNIADDIAQSGTYVFTLHRCDPPGTNVSAGLVAKSEPFVYTAPTAVLGAPTNLRFEVSGDKIFCVWDAPANWVQGRDLFIIDVTNAGSGTGNGGGTRSVPIPDARREINFSVFDGNEYNPGATANGIYTFAVRAVSGDITAIQSAADFTEGTATYSYPDGAVSNPAGTVVTPPAPAAKTAYMREQAITIDGVAMAFQAYVLKDEKGNETNYVKLRDVAAKLNGTSAQFNVAWDGSVNIETGKAYVPNGSEMSTPFTGDRPYTEATSPTKVNGAPANLDAFVLTDDKGAGYTYYKLRDLGEALGFKVDWSADKGITVDTGAAAPAPVGKIEHPTVTDPTLTAPTDLKLVIGTRTEYGTDGQPKQVPSATPGVTFTNTAGDRAKSWIVRLYDEKDRRLVDTYWNGNPANLAYDLDTQESGTISTITITPVDPGTDGYVSRGANSDDKVGVTAVFKCQISVTAKAGEPVTLSTAPTDWSDEDWNLTLSLKVAPFGYGILTSKYTEVYPDGGSGQHTTGRGVSADESGTLVFSEEISRFETVYTSAGAKLSLAIFTDAAVSEATGSYTVTVHPVTVQK